MNNNKKNKQKIKKKLMKGDFPSAQQWINEKKRNFDILCAIYGELKNEEILLNNDEYLSLKGKTKLAKYDLIANLLLSDKLKRIKGQKDLLKVDF